MTLYKIIFSLSIFTFFLSSIGQSYYSLDSRIYKLSADTTIKAGIDPDKKIEIINVSFPNLRGSSIYDFVLTVENDTAKGIFEMMDDAVVQLTDIDNTDGFIEIVITALGPSDMNDHKIFGYRGNKIVKLGDFSQYFGFSSNGDGILKAEEWMGFWTKTELFKLDNEYNKLLLIPQETYSLEIDAVVTTPFNILRERINGSNIVKTLQHGTKIKLIEADTSPICLTDRGYVDDFNCDWYLIKTEDGKTGWARLETFRDLVDGLIWAG